MENLYHNLFIPSCPPAGVGYWFCYPTRLGSTCPIHSQTNLLTSGRDEGNWCFLQGAQCGARQGEQKVLSQKTQSLWWLPGKGFIVSGVFLFVCLFVCWQGNDPMLKEFIDNKALFSFDMLSRLVITFLPRSKRLLISRLQSTTAVILGPLQKNKVYHCFHCFPICLPWSDGIRCHDLSFLNVEF